MKTYVKLIVQYGRVIFFLLLPSLYLICAFSTVLVNVMSATLLHVHNQVEACFLFSTNAIIPSFIHPSIPLSVALIIFSSFFFLTVEKENFSKRNVLKCRFYFVSLFSISFRLLKCF